MEDNPRTDSEYKSPEHLNASDSIESQIDSPECGRDSSRFTFAESEWNEDSSCLHIEADTKFMTDEVYAVWKTELENCSEGEVLLEEDLQCPSSVRKDLTLVQSEHEKESEVKLNKKISLLNETNGISAVSVHTHRKAAFVKSQDLKQTNIDDNTTMIAVASSALLQNGALQDAQQTHESVHCITALENFSLSEESLEQQQYFQLVGDSVTMEMPQRKPITYRGNKTKIETDEIVQVEQSDRYKVKVGSKDLSLSSMDAPSPDSDIHTNAKANIQQLSLVCHKRRQSLVDDDLKVVSIICENVAELTLKLAQLRLAVLLCSIFTKPHNIFGLFMLGITMPLMALQIPFDTG